jgi:TolA-binding protein
LALVVWALAASPAIFRVSAADKTMDALNEIQRDIADLTGQVRELQKTQADQIVQMKTLVQQAVDASSRSAQTMEQSQKAFSDSLTNSMKSAMSDQQTRIAAPVADLNAKVGELGQDMTAVQNTVADMQSRLTKMQSKLDDVYNLVQAPPVAAPPAAVPAPAANASTNGAPAGMTAPSLRQAAERDFSAGNSLALQELADYVKYFHDDAWAPTAQFKIGDLYRTNSQFEDAADAYDAVVTKFPTNDMTAQGAYFKGVALQQGKHNADALEQYKKVASAYPGTEWARKAKDKVTQLGPASKSGSRGTHRQQ